ncbi:MAG: DUF971 domain-containing protein [Phycisphaerales bacterium]|nr:DUF971 domain-containing protein [Phycisphaerales bacterium]
MLDEPPEHLELRKREGLVIRWRGGETSFFPLTFLRRMSPSADARAIREALAANPLTVIPTSSGHAPLEALTAELVGNYALRIRFNDGHDTGLYSWKYLREIAPQPSTSDAPRTGSDSQ